MSRVTQVIFRLLLLIHAILVAWGVLGLVEYVAPAVPLGLQSPAFPPGLQFLHFASVLATGLVFLGGYLARSRHLSFAMVTMYAVLATICFVETVDFGAFGGGMTRFIPMSIEYVTYIGISLFLLHTWDQPDTPSRAKDRLG